MTHDSVYEMKNVFIPEIRKTFRLFRYLVVVAYNMHDHINQQLLIFFPLFQAKVDLKLFGTPVNSYLFSNVHKNLNKLDHNKLETHQWVQQHPVIPYDLK